METRVCRLYSKGDVRVELESVGSPGPGEALVRISRGGICGTDLHYYQDGGIGEIRVREPIILGHELAGIIEAVGAGVDSVDVGDRVAINPSQPCGECEFCLNDVPQHCLEMRFIGSAMRLPHEQGGFRDRMIVQAGQCFSAPKETPLPHLACSEPLAVCLHAAGRAGNPHGKKVLITGAGPIGALCTAVAKNGGAEEIVVADLQDFALQVAGKMGAIATVNVLEAPEDMETYYGGKGYFDLVFECSAAEKAIETVLRAVKPQGTVVQVGVSAPLLFPVNILVGKEIQLLGSQRFHTEFAEAVAMIGSGRINVAPIITDTFSLTEAEAAIKASSDRSNSVKVQLSFDTVLS